MRSRAEDEDLIARFQKTNLKDDVAAFIREGIFSGRFLPGMKLDQDWIAETLMVSKLPVREAIILLEAEGLVQGLPRRGAFIAPLTPEDIFDHYHIYALVASSAAERAAGRITPEDLDKLERLIHEMQRWESRESAEGQEVLNERFHRIINRAGGSRRLNSVMRSLVLGIPARLYHETRGWTSTAQDEHREILRALRAGDGPAAARAVAVHIDSGAHHAVRSLRANGFWGSDPDAEGPIAAEELGVAQANG
jgi:DNA-binding GntR family transcriptional regulator